ncbi:MULTISPECIES: SPFH domain-containing protein [Paenibacillus]|jgi:membrane protease subunit (stomatin/prohibitin family)|uniref:SPFH domain-containing protein n=1 Tax=Paenibacillus TaxID=44249 RepID=UPI00096CBD27|nr:SPFH domain-containing protein [Paenibacillus odorifer]MEC0132075.1 SPFH domain-containing protein [Paenibacillus odorifer]MEC0220147.1 SPFH domain-containing protein [Paenibacillus odorifer]OMC96934.1 antifreeze protein type I [Paenibacillus odorifer]OMD08263.1 antifreeze protein type I [Paenibacillus odorifer]OMD13954.1 antifreeze protein type I [Paenibacillus odorifer]
MAIIEVVKYDGPPGIFAWKYPNQELGTWTQLIVNESQEAILFKGGQALDSFTAGRHTLSTANIPILSNIVNLPFGGKSPFTAEVWYVNKTNSMNVKWGTSSPLQLQDPKYKIMISVRSFGQFGVKIDDPRKFLLKLVGTLPQFDHETLISYFRGLLMSNINELISSYLVHKQISILEINAYVAEISKHIQGRLASAFLDNGIELNNFYIDSINIPEDDPATIRLKEALAKKAEMDIIGFTYQQERGFDTMEEAAGNPGNLGVGMMNTGMGLGLGMGFAGPAMDMVNRMTRGMNLDSGTTVIRQEQRSCSKCGVMNPVEGRFCSGCGQALGGNPQGSPSANKIKCFECGHELNAGAKFCPGCGNPYRPCPSCKADNPEGAASCVSCGKEMPKACGKCGTMVAPGVKFCPHCGDSMVIKCSGCGHELKAGQKFCAECGTKAG